MRSLNARLSSCSWPTPSLPGPVDAVRDAKGAVAPAHPSLPDSDRSRHGASPRCVGTVPTARAVVTSTMHDHVHMDATGMHHHNNDTRGDDHNTMARTYRVTPIQRMINAYMTAMVRIGVAPRREHLLTTTGRKSGQSRTVPVSVVDDGDNRWLVSPYGTVGWVHNLRASGAATLQRRSTSEPIPAKEVDPENEAPIIQRSLKRTRL